jgi:hypothetical protein
MVAPAAPATPLWGKRGGVLPPASNSNLQLLHIYPTGEVSPARASPSRPRSAWEPPFTMRRYFSYRGRDMYATNSHVHNQASHTQKTLCYGPRVHRESPLPEPTRSATGRSLAIFGRSARSPGARPLHTQPVTAPPTSVGVRSHATSRNSWKLPAAYQSRAITLRAFYHLHAATLRVFTR